MTTDVVDTKAVPPVATAPGPLVGTVQAGTIGSFDHFSPFGPIAFDMGVTEQEWDLIVGIRGGRAGVNPYDDPEFITNALREGSTLESLARGRAAYQERMNAVHDATQRYLAAVDARRPLAPAQDEPAALGRQKAAEILDRLVQLAGEFADHLYPELEAGHDGAWGFAADNILATSNHELPGVIESVDSASGAGAFAVALFGPGLMKNPKDVFDIHAQADRAFSIARAYLATDLVNRSSGAASFLLAAAIAAQRVMECRKKAQQETAKAQEAA